MITLRGLPCLALLALAAACSGSSGAGGGAPGGAAGARAAGGVQGLPATTFTSPAAVATSDGTTAMAADASSQAYTVTGSNTPADPAILTVKINSAGVSYSNSYDLTNVTLPTEAAFQNTPFQQTDPTKNGNNDGSYIVFDDRLDYSQYGVWKSGDGKVISAFATGSDTPVSDIQARHGQASYEGGAIGRGTSGGNTFTLAGTSNVNVNFDNYQVNGQWNMAVADSSGNGAGQLNVTTTQAALAPNSNKISGSISATSSGSTLVPATMAGQMTAALYGAGAAEIGGVGTLSGANASAVFGFGGKATPPVSSAGEPANMTVNFNNASAPGSIWLSSGATSGSPVVVGASGITGSFVPPGSTGTSTTGSIGGLPPGGLYGPTGAGTVSGTFGSGSTSTPIAGSFAGAKH